MYTSRSQPKLNAKMGLIVISILSLVNACIGTALSPPLYLCIITLLLTLLAFQPKWPGMVGIIGLTTLGFIFLLGEFVEKNTYQVLNPVTFNVLLALVVLTEIILALLMITSGGITIIQERQAHHQAAT